MQAPPYIRLSSYYFFYFAILGAFIPYWPLYLEALKFDPVQIGESIAILMATKIVAPIVWGWIADHTGRRLRVVQIATLASMLSFTGVLFTDSFWGVAAVMVLFGFFWDSSLPQFEAVTLSYLGTDVHRYSRIRLWGSVGFIFSAVLLAPALDYYGTGILPYVLLLLIGAIWINTLLVPREQGGVNNVNGRAFWSVFLSVEVGALFVACFFMQASHGAYYSLFSVYLEAHGYTRSWVGVLWGLGVCAEILVFLLMHRWLPRFGAVRLMNIALAITVLRWFIIAQWVDVLVLLVLAQLMHAASYGLFHSAAIHLIQERFPGRLQGRGQALYTSLSFGLGGAVGAYLSGHVWEAFGPSLAYIAASLFAFGGLLAGLLVARRHRCLAQFDG